MMSTRKAKDQSDLYYHAYMVGWLMTISGAIWTAHDIVQRNAGTFWRWRREIEKWLEGAKANPASVGGALMAGLLIADLQLELAWGEAMWGSED